MGKQKVICVKNSVALNDGKLVATVAGGVYEVDFLPEASAFVEFNTKNFKDNQQLIVDAITEKIMKDIDSGKTTLAEVTAKLLAMIKDIKEEIEDEDDEDEEEYENDDVYDGPDCGDENCPSCNQNTPSSNPLVARKFKIGDYAVTTRGNNDRKQLIKIYSITVINGKFDGYNAENGLAFGENDLRKPTAEELKEYFR